MARARNIKPGFWRNEALVELPFQARLLFIGLWNIADREGRLENRPKKIKMEIFPGDDVDVSLEITRLSEAGLVMVYRAENVDCIEVINFKKHQNPHHREPSSELPPPDNDTKKPAQPFDNKEASESPGLASGEPQPSRAESLLLIPDSGYLIPDPIELPCASDAARLDDHGKSPELYSEDFNRFWKAYPSKKNKRTAALKFKTLRKKNTSTEFLSRLVEDVECRARGHEWLKENGQFIPHAATYLNQERWNDPAPVTDITTGSNRSAAYKTVDERNREVALQWAAGGDFYDQQ